MIKNGYTEQEIIDKIFGSGDNMLHWKPSFNKRFAGILNHLMINSNIMVKNNDGVGYYYAI